MKNYLILLLCFITVVSYTQIPDYKSPLLENKSEEKSNRNRSNYSGYRGHFDAGIISLSLIQPDSNIYFSTHTSHGYYNKNYFIGLGIGFDKLDTLTLLPLFIDTRFTFTGKLDNSLNYDETRSTVNLFFRLKGGYIFKTLNDIQNNKSGGIFFQPGLGFLIGKMRDVRFLIEASYTYQEISNFTLIEKRGEFHTYNVKIGVELSL